MNDTKLISQISRGKACEDAPAEAGETLEARFPELNDDLIRMASTGSTGSLTEWGRFIERLQSALSAQPQARDDAQPVGWLRAVDEEMVCAHLGVAEAEDSYETAKKKLASLIQWNIAVAMDPSIGGPLASDELRAAVSDIAAERQRQVDAEGWSADRDDGYADAELAKSAAAYTLSACGFSPGAARLMWPRSWSAHWWKPTTARRDLVKAGALIVTEIERLDRQALAALQAEQGAK